MGKSLPSRPEPLAFNPEPVSDELRDRDQWVCWQYKLDADRDEWIKIPIDPSTRRAAKTNDPATWTSFAKAVAYHDRASTDIDGVGFVVHDDDPVTGIDLDDCRDPDTGESEPWASDLMDDVSTYTEVSPSGTGLRLFGFGIIPDGGNRADVEGADGHLEMYDTGRYLTVTGHDIDDAPADIRQVNDEIRAIHAEYIATDDSESSIAANGSLDVGYPDTERATEKSGSEDNDLLAEAKAAENGDKFVRLWEGDTSDYPSHSEADLALCSMLAFWTNRDHVQIDRLFRQSELYRDKWDENRGEHTYGERTIAKALSGVTEGYDLDQNNTGDVPSVLPANPTPPDSAANNNATDDGKRDTDGGDNADETDGHTSGMNVTLCPSEVAVWAGLGEDEDVSDLNDRQKAASVWKLLNHTDRFHVRVRRDNGSLWAYEDGVWKPTGERALRHAARKALGSMNYGSNVLAELKAQARSDPTAEVNANDLGLDPGYLAVENGLVNLEAAADGAVDEAIRELQPDDYALTRLPVRYDPSASYDRWDRYVEEWAEDGRADALQEYVGYCLHIGSLPIHRALLLVGTGANGKGTFLSVIRDLLGQENTTSIELQTLANEKDALADFYGALANIDDDLSARKLGQGLGMFKKLVGGDRVRARNLYEDGFEFNATGKHLYAANEVPDVKVPDDDEAFWRRWILVEFPNHYPPSERDPDLRDELTTDDALSEVLNWAIDGWQRLLDQGYFTNEDHYAQAKRERWQAWGESVDKFISECVDHDPDADRITTTDAHRRYTAWCRENSLDPVGQREFTNTLKAEDVGYKTGVRIDGKSQRGYKTLGLSDDVPDLDDTPERAAPDDAHQDSLF